MSNPVFAALNSDPEHTPVEAKQSEIELLFEGVNDLKIVCARVDDRSMQMLQRMDKRDAAIDALKRRQSLLGLAPLVLAFAALVMSGIALALAR